MKDNGIGFDGQNFEAFSTSDTTYKAARGGKGIGRFMWLAAFDHAEIESVFRSDAQMKCRRFTFNPRGTGIESATCIEAPNREPMTICACRGLRRNTKLSAQNACKQSLPSLWKNFWSISLARLLRSSSYETALPGKPFYSTVFRRRNGLENYREELHDQRQAV